MSEKVLKFHKDDRYVRFMVWVYDEMPMGFCLLFWLTLLSPVVICAKPILGRTASIVVALGTAGRLDTALAYVSLRVEGHGRLLARLWLGVVFVYWAGLAVLLASSSGWWMLLLPANGVVLYQLVSKGSSTRFAVFMKTRFAVFIKTAYRSFKTRTCPRVEFVDE